MSLKEQGYVSSTLKRQLQRKLDLSRSRRSGFQLARTRGPKARIIQLRLNSIREGEIGVVEHVEELRPELEIESLTEFAVLDEGQIKGAYARPGDTVAAAVAKSVFRIGP